MVEARKRIILGLTQSFDFSDVMESELKKLGFDVINIAYPDHVFKYKNYLQRIQNFFMKSLLNDKHFKNKLKFKPFEKSIKTKLNSTPIADYALIIRPDIYPEEILKLIKARSKTMIGYQWDGLERFKSVKDYIPLFDRFFAFDIAEKNYGNNILPLTNFYFENNDIVTNSKNNIAFFLGSYFKSRMEIIGQCAENLSKFGTKPNFYLFAKDDAIDYPNIQFISEAISYSQYLTFLKEASIVADFLNPVHGGLSFRVFEAIGYKKKLITTNKAIRNYDFYNPSNIFVLENNNWGALAQFLAGNYEPIPEEIIKKYSFQNWIHYILNIEPHQKITVAC